MCFRHPWTIDISYFVESISSKVRLDPTVFLCCDGNIVFQGVTKYQSKTTTAVKMYRTLENGICVKMIYLLYQNITILI